MVFVFKTNIANQWQKEGISKLLKRQFSYLPLEFDLEDCDKVLRIESSFEVTQQVIQLMQENGYDCEELID
jgi:hypothetical protein